MRTKGRAIVALAVAASAACGSQPPSAPSTATSVPVSLAYRTFTPTGAVPVLGDYCFRNIVPAGIVVAFPSWTSEARMKEMEGVPLRYGLTLYVQPGHVVRVAVRDGFRCYAADPPPDDLWAREGLTGNGTAITKVEPLSAAQPDVPAFTFRVTTDGRVH